MGNYICGEYVILNADDSNGIKSGNENQTEASVLDASEEAAPGGGGGGDARLSLLEISRLIRRSMLRIQGEYMTSDASDSVGNYGTLVDYRGLKESEAFAEYLKLARLLRHAPLASLVEDEDERRAFFINVYNALNVHGVISRGGSLPPSLVGKLGYWKRTAYSIDGTRFTLDDIEHGILRGDSRSSAQLWGGDSYFAASDPRKKYALPKDPRIHFALNCGARSCPVIRVYDPRNLDAGLRGATSSFCGSEVKVVDEGDDDDAGAEVRLSHLFKWFRGDFVVGPPQTAEEEEDEAARDLAGGKVDPVLRWIVRATRGTSCPPAEELRAAMEKGKALRIVYEPYDWASNGR